MKYNNKKKILTMLHHHSDISFTLIGTYKISFITLFPRKVLWEVLCKFRYLKEKDYIVLKCSFMKLDNYFLKKIITDYKYFIKSTQSN